MFYLITGNIQVSKCQHMVNFCTAPQSPFHTPPQNNLDTAQNKSHREKKYLFSYESSKSSRRRICDWSLWGYLHLSTTWKIFMKFLNTKRKGR